MSISVACPCPRPPGIASMYGNVCSLRVWEKGTCSRTNKTFRGTNFHFPRSSACCLPSAARLDMADDQGKGKIVPRKGLFVQEHNFLSSIPSWDTFFHSAGGFQPPVQKSVNRRICRLHYGYPLFFPCYFSNNWNYGCPQFPGVPLKIAGAKPLQFSHNSKLVVAPSFQEFP